MTNKIVDQTFQVVNSDTSDIQNLISAFITDRRSRQFSKNTIHYYQVELGLFTRCLDGLRVVFIEELTPTLLRNYMLELEEKRNPGGRLASFRAIRAFLRWVWDELELETRNPFTKLQSVLRRCFKVFSVGVKVFVEVCSPCPLF